MKLQGKLKACIVAYIQWTKDFSCILISGSFIVGREGPGPPWCCVVMAWRYIKMAMCGTVAARRREEEDLHAAAIVACMDFGSKLWWGGSVPGHEVKKRKRDEINEQIMRNYFNDPPLYGDALFRRR